MAIIDLGEYGADFVADPYPYYAKWREAGPVHQVRGVQGDEFWLIVGHEEARAALTDPRLLKSPAVVGRMMLDERVIGPNLLVLDPPDHTAAPAGDAGVHRSPRGATGPAHPADHR